MRSSLLLMLAVMAGCRSQDVILDRVPAGSECRTGGLRVTTPGGQSEVICNGNDGTSGLDGGSGSNGTDGVDGVEALVGQNVIPLGDPRCPFGGVEVVSGLDTGADGGTAGDRTLQPGEVSARTVVCGGGSQAIVGSMTPPAGMPGTATLKVNGGDATSLASDGGFAGAGGTVQLVFDEGTNGGHLKVWKTGHVDANAPFPTVPPPSFGAHPLEVNVNITVLINTSSSIPAGVVYANSGHLYLSQGPANPPIEYTDLSVAAGVTLTLPNMEFVFERSCRINGAIRVSTVTPADVFGLHCVDVVLSSGSSVTAPSGGASQRPTNVLVNAYTGSVLSLGTIDTTSPVGIEPGAITLRADTSIFTAGVLRTSAASGGVVPTTAGAVTIRARNQLVNAARIDSRGSTGAALEPAGRGGAVELRAARIKSTGTIDVRGGSSPMPSDNCLICSGGAGGSISMIADTSLLADGDWLASGGSGWLSGNGGTVDLLVGSLALSASIDASGGSGSNGGAGGAIAAHIRQGAPIGSELMLLGYSSLQASAGVGPTLSFNGRIELLHAAGPNGTAGGGIFTDTDLLATGGRYRGTIILRTQNTQPGASWEVINEAGNLSVRSGREAGGGDILMTGVSGVSLAGTLDARGGDAAGLEGGAGGAVYIDSSGPIVQMATIDNSAGASGGGSTLGPGGGGWLSLIGSHVTCGATLKNRGGAADVRTGTGGQGGYIVLTSRLGGTVITVPKPAGIDASGGAGMTPGASGQVVIDGLVATNDWTH